MTAAAATRYRDDTRCACKHYAGAHHRDRPGCAMSCSCPGFVPSWRERLKDAAAALRAVRAALRGGR